MTSGPPSTSTAWEPVAAIELVRTWARCYTAFLHPEVQAARRSELESDLWEHREHGRRTGTGDAVIATEVVTRLLRGVPDDVLWRFSAGAAESRAARTRDSDGRSWMMSTSIRLGRGPGVVAAGALWLLMLGVGLLFWWLDIPVDGRLAQAYWAVAVGMVVVFLISVVGVLQLKRHSKAARWGLRAFLAGAGLGGLGVAMMIVELPGWALLGPAYLVAVLGWITFAVANIRAPALPRWNALPLAIGLVPIVFTVFEALDLGLWVLPTGLGAFGVAWTLLAFAVWSPRPVAEGDTGMVA